jgi:hypothetical protein
MTVEYIIGAAIVVLAVAMYFKFREKPVDMDHKAPNVHNVVENAVNGPAPVAAAPAPKAVKAAAPAKKTTKKTATKKEAKVDLDAMSKKDLLALAKEKGVKANASLSKAEIVERLK